MIRFLPQHKFSREELSLIPEALFCLLRSRLEVTFLPSRKWLAGGKEQGAGSGEAQGSGLRAQGEERQSEVTVNRKREMERGSEGATGRLDDGATKGLRDVETKGLGDDEEPLRPTLNFEPGTLNSKDHESQITNYKSQITNKGLQDCKTARPQDLSIANIINGLALRTPWKSTCLVKALAASKMLSKRHIPHSIHFGMKKDQTGKYEAHAWVSVEDRILIGGENRGEYKEVGRFQA